MVLAFESEPCGEAVQVQGWREETVSSWSASGCGGCSFVPQQVQVPTGSLKLQFTLVRVSSQSLKQLDLRTEK